MATTAVPPARKKSTIKWPGWLLAVGVVLLLLWFLLAAMPLIALNTGYFKVENDSDVTRVQSVLAQFGTFGDMFGCLNVLFSGFALLGAIYAIWLQHQEMDQNQRDQINALQSATYSQIMGRLHDINRLEIEMHNVKLFSRLYEPYPERGLPNGDPLRHYLFMIINLYEEVYQQHKVHNLLSEQLWTAWERRIRNDFHRPGLAGYWAEFKSSFPEEFTPDFVAFLNSCVTQQVQDGLVRPQPGV